MLFILVHIINFFCPRMTNSRQKYPTKAGLNIPKHSCLRFTYYMTDNVTSHSWMVIIWQITWPVTPEWLLYDRLRDQSLLNGYYMTDCVTSHSWTVRFVSFHILPTQVMCPFASSFWNTNTGATSGHSKFVHELII